MEVSSLTQEGRITIPASMRKILDLQSGDSGDRVEFILQGQEALLRKHSTQPAC
jgi:AbrB family looped-hinge helix DNA binding protein